MGEDKEFQHQPITNTLYLLQQALDCSDLSTYTEQIIKHIQYNQSKNPIQDASEEVKVTANIYLVMIVILFLVLIISYYYICIYVSILVHYLAN
jgi:ABC-type Na+ efflux pump permease subunit